ncbi:MAG: Prophage LambdaCh01, recombination protein Bet [Parcubacteria bacterium 32_520]|nr:MAG: Prophage LambdaCh01, recombination protein Bet [Parcubacteria bacterium 32_520]
MKKETTQNKAKKITKKASSKKKETKKIVVKEQQITDPALLTKAKIDLIKRTVAKGATDDELQMFLTVAARAGLDPFTKQIHLVKRHSTAEGRDIATIQTGIDGYRAIAEKTGKYGGSDDATFTFADGQDKIPTSATVKVYKIIGDKVIEIKATAYWDEFAPTNEKLAFMWRKMPKLMLAKCAEALALRKAFPNVLSGIYTHEEMEQLDEEKNVNDKKATLANSKAYIYSAKSLDELKGFRERIEKSKIDKATKEKLLKYCQEKEVELSAIEAEIESV